MVYIWQKYVYMAKVRIYMAKVRIYGKSTYIYGKSTYIYGTYGGRSKISSLHHFLACLRLPLPIQGFFYFIQPT